MNDDTQGEENQGQVPSRLPSETDSNPYASSVTPPPSVGGAVNKEERNWALIAHLSSLSIFVGIPGFIGPLIVWLVKKDELPFASAQAKEALNFQISLFAYSIACIILIFTVIGVLIAIPAIIALGIMEVVLTIIAAIQAGEGRSYRYPLTFRLIE